MTLSGTHSCTNCRNIVDRPTKYKESNQGEVILCAICKPKVRQSSFHHKKKDALDFASTGGGFEGNRSKH